MFKSINKIGGYIKVSRYTKIHLALKKIQPPWTHKAIQAWMHPFWLKKISSVLCWGTGTGCAKPIFDTQIISNRKYSNPLFPLTMLWFWETETQWWKEQVCGHQYKWESLISGHPIACERGWLGNIHGPKRLPELRVHKRGLGGMGFFPPFSQGLVQSLLNWTKRFLKALLSWAPQRFVLRVSLHGQMDRACPGCTGCALSAPPSLMAHGDTHLTNYLCSHCRRGGKENPTKAKELGKEKKIWLSEFGTLQDHSELGVVTPPTLWARLLLDSLSPCMELVDLQQQIQLFHNANDTVELWQGWIWRCPQPKCISAARLFSNAA